MYYQLKLLCDLKPGHSDLIYCFISHLLCIYSEPQFIIMLNKSRFNECPASVLMSNEWTNDRMNITKQSALNRLGLFLLCWTAFNDLWLTKYGGTKWIKPKKQNKKKSNQVHIQYIGYAQLISLTSRHNPKQNERKKPNPDHKLMSCVIKWDT